MNTSSNKPFIIQPAFEVARIQHTKNVSSIKLLQRNNLIKYIENIDKMSLHYIDNMSIMITSKAITRLKKRANKMTQLQNEFLGKFEFLGVHEYDEQCSLDVLHCNNACALRDELFLNGYQVDFEVEITNILSVTKRFNVSFQNEERTNGMMAYSLSGMTTSSIFGNDSDQSGELYNFLEENEEYGFYEFVIDSLIDKANAFAKLEYNYLLKNHNLEIAKLEIAEAAKAFELEMVNFTFTLEEFRDYIFGEADFVEFICKRYDIDVSINPNLRNVQHDLIHSYFIRPTAAQKLLENYNGDFYNTVLNSSIKCVASYEDAIYSYACFSDGSAVCGNEFFIQESYYDFVMALINQQ